MVMKVAMLDKGKIQFLVKFNYFLYTFATCISNSNVPYSIKRLFLNDKWQQAVILELFRTSINFIRVRIYLLNVMARTKQTVKNSTRVERLACNLRPWWSVRRNLLMKLKGIAFAWELLRYMKFACFRKALSC